MNARTHYETLAKQAAGEKGDVLAHLQILANDMRALGKPMSAEQLDVVRAAVAELVSAARDAATILQDKAGPMEQETPHRLWSALARTGASA